MRRSPDVSNISPDEENNPNTADFNISSPFDNSLIQVKRTIQQLK
jgi:hypothetical protein